MVAQDVNDAREAEGLPPLVRDRRLDALAAQVAALQHHYQRRVVLEGEGAQARGPTSGPVLDADLTGIGVHVCYEGPTAFVTVVLGAAADQVPALPAPQPTPALPVPPLLLGGLHTVTICRWERGARPVPAWAAELLRAVLGGQERQAAHLPRLSDALRQGGAAPCLALWGLAGSMPQRQWWVWVRGRPASHRPLAGVLHRSGATAGHGRGEDAVTRKPNHQVRAWLAGARLRSDARRVHIDGQVWHWKAGRSGIKLWDPAGQSRFVLWPRFLGLPIHEVERLQRKRSLAVTLADVAAYVNSGLGTNRSQPLVEVGPTLQALAAAARGAQRR